MIGLIRKWDNLKSLIYHYFFPLFFFCTATAFLMKRRQKELGLYNILGTGKRHISICR